MYHRKMYSFFPCIPIFRWFFSIESVKRMCIRDYVKIALLLVKNVFFGLEKSISEFLHWVAQKHTAVSLLTFGRLILRWLLRGWPWLLVRSKLFCWL